MSKENNDAEKASASSMSEPTGINSGVAIIGFILCFLAGAMLMWGYDQQAASVRVTSAPTPPRAPSGRTRTRRFRSSSKDPMWGSRTAPVTIVIFSDFQCPFCRRVEPTLQQVRETYGPDKVRIVWKNEPLPFHPNAQARGRGGQGVFALEGNDAFWKFHDKAFGEPEGRSAATSYDEWAKDVGRRHGEVQGRPRRSHVGEEGRRGQRRRPQAVGANGTPAIFINGVEALGRAALRQVQGRHRPGAPEGAGEDRRGHAEGQDLRGRCRRRTRRTPRRRKQDEGEKEDTKTVFKVPRRQGSPQSAATRSALVTIVEFSDFQCPYCKRVEPTLQGAPRHVRRQGPPRLEERAAPVPPARRTGRRGRARGSRREGDKGFWDAHDKLFDIQPKLDEQDLENGREGPRPRRPKVDNAIKNAQVEEATRRRTSTSRRTSRRRARRTSSSTAAASSARSRSRTSSRRSSTKRSRRRTTSSRRAIAPEALYDTPHARTAKGARGGDSRRRTSPIPPDAPWKGNKNAKVVIQEFSRLPVPVLQRRRGDRRPR